jgi:hypothetical protein
MAEPDWPTMEEVKDQLRIQGSDTMDDRLVDECRAAARKHITLWLDRGNLEEVHPDVRRAAAMYAARLFKRRDSLDGTLGMPDVGVIRMNYGRDNDIDKLITPHRRFAVG